MSTQFMAIRRGKLAGPFTLDQLHWMEQSGEISDVAQVCSKEGGSSWTTWAQLKEGHSPAPRPELPTAQPRPLVYAARAPIDPRFMEEDGPPLSRIAYIILALFMGTAGVHNFYARRIGEGAGQLALMLTAFMCAVAGFPILAVPLLGIDGAWAIGNIIVTTRDGYGRDLL